MDDVLFWKWKYLEYTFQLEYIFQNECVWVSE